MLTKTIKRIRGLFTRTARFAVQQIKRLWDGICGLFSLKRMEAFAMMLFASIIAFAQNSAGDYSAGVTALTNVTEEIAKYVPYVVKLCYAIAGIVAIVGAVSVYVAMNNDEQDVKKKIMMVVGACIFLVAAAQALPMFFGLSGS